MHIVLTVHLLICICVLTSLPLYGDSCITILLIHIYLLSFCWQFRANNDVLLNFVYFRRKSIFYPSLSYYHLLTFITPAIPTFCVLPCKQFYSWQIATYSNYFISYFVRFLAMFSSFAMYYT